MSFVIRKTQKQKFRKKILNKQIPDEHKLYKQIYYV